MSPMPDGFHQTSEWQSGMAARRGLAERNTPGSYTVLRRRRICDGS
jgi:hypothetical protein